MVGVSPPTGLFPPDDAYLLLPIGGRVDEHVQEARPLPVAQAQLQSGTQLLHRPHQEASASERRHDLVVAGLREQGHRRGSDGWQK